MAGQGGSHLPRLFTPGVAVLLGFVLMVGNPWLNRDLTVALYDYDSVARLVNVLFSFPGWYVDVDQVGPFLFWFANLRTVLFIAFGIFGLGKVSRWARGTVGEFVVTVGLVTLSAVAAGLGSAAVAVTLVTTGDSLPFVDASRPEEFFLGQLSASSSFGVLFGLVLGVVGVMQHRAPVRGEPRVDKPKSFW